MKDLIGGRRMRAVMLRAISSSRHPPYRHLWKRASIVDVPVTSQRSHASVSVAAAVAGVAIATTATGIATCAAHEDDPEHVLVNWSSSHECRPCKLYVPESTVDVERVLREHHEKGEKLRCMGSGVSPNGLGFSAKTAGREHQNDAVMSMALLDKVLGVDLEKKQVTVEAGIIVGDLLDKLGEHGLTMQNVASIRDQQVGGITQAGCHGSGASISPIDDHVVEMEIVTPAQGRMTLSAMENPDLFALAKCGLGALGVVTKLTLQCVDKYYLAEKTTVTTVDDVRKNHARWLVEFQHLRYMWIPNTDAVVVVQCKRISEEEAAHPRCNEKYPPPPHSADEQLETPRNLYLQLAQGRADPDYHSWSFTKLRDKILEFNPLDTQLVVQMNQSEKEFWKLNQGYRVGASVDIIGFDCGGDQLVLEVAFPTTATLDIDFVEQLLRRIDDAGIPAPSPIEQRWTATSSSRMSPASSWNPNQVFSWVGVIMYLPSSQPDVRDQIWKKFGDYHELCRDAMEPFGGIEHWAKIEWPSDVNECRSMRQRLQRRYPLVAFKKARDEVDPNHVLSNHIVDQLCG